MLVAFLVSWLFKEILHFQVVKHGKIEQDLNLSFCLSMRLPIKAALHFLCCICATGTKKLLTAPKNNVLGARCGPMILFCTR